MEEDTELLLAARQLIYSIVARAYAEEADEALLEAIKSEQLDVALSLACENSDVEQLKNELAKVRQCIAPKDGGKPSGCISGLRAQYVHIFVGPETLHAAPWESMHVSSDQGCSQSVVLSVRHAYRQAGLLPERYRRVSDDFIGLEFDFMAKLARFALEDYQQGKMEECKNRLMQSQRFLQDHLLRWINSLYVSMNDHYDECFYSAITAFASSFISADEVELSRILGNV